MDRYLVDFLSVFANFSCVIVVLGTPSPNVPLIIGQQNYDRQLSPQKRRDFLLISGEQGFFSEPPLARNSHFALASPSPLFPWNTQKITPFLQATVDWFSSALHGSRFRFSVQTSSLGFLFARDQPWRTDEGITGLPFKTFWKYTLQISEEDALLTND